MKNQNRLIELQKQLKMFEDEENNSKKYTEDYKKKISEEIKKLKPKDVKNTEVTEIKYTVWERLLRTLGMN
jgi:hypothetical protein